MSAYLVNNKSISVIARNVKYYAKQASLPYLLEGYHKGWLSTDNKEFAGRFYHLLLDINLVSLGQRYEDIKSWSKEGKKYEYNHQEAPLVSVPVLLDLISNWKYQSCEGIANESDFYKLIEKVESKLALMHVNHGRETKWGIDNYSELTDEDKNITQYNTY